MLLRLGDNSSYIAGRPAQPARQFVEVLLDRVVGHACTSSTAFIPVANRFHSPRAVARLSLPRAVMA